MNQLKQDRYNKFTTSDYSVYLEWMNNSRPADQVIIYRQTRYTIARLTKPAQYLVTCRPYEFRHKLTNIYSVSRWLRRRQMKAMNKKNHLASWT